MIQRLDILEHEVLGELCWDSGEVRGQNHDLIDDGPHLAIDVHGHIRLMGIQFQAIGILIVR